MLKFVAPVALFAVGVLITSLIPVSRQYNSTDSLVQGVSTESARVVSDNGQTAIVQGLSGALTSLPVEVNPTTQTVSITTSKGQQLLTVLPEAAIQSAQTSEVLDDVQSVKVEGSLASIRQLIRLDDKNGQMNYTVEGQKNHSVLGIAVKTNVKVVVSVDNGQVKSTETSLLGRILNKLSR